MAKGRRDIWKQGNLELGGEYERMGVHINVRNVSKEGNSSFSFRVCLMGTSSEMVDLVKLKFKFD